MAKGDSEAPFVDVRVYGEQPWLAVQPEQHLSRGGDQGPHLLRPSPRSPRPRSPKDYRRKAFNSSLVFDPG